MPAPTRVLTVDDVHRYVDDLVFGTPANASGPSGRVGIELEWITVTRDAGPSSPARMAALLPELPGASRLTFEPGGQLELSGPPAELGPALHAMRADTAAVRRALDTVGVDLVGAGMDTRGDVARVLDAARYRAMEAYFDTAWPEGRTMMRKTASVQVNVDLGAPDVVDDRWHLAHDLGPLLTACFANSPFDGSGRPSGYRSTRAAVWSAIDPARTTPARRDPSAAAAAEWARYVLDAPVMMVRIDDDHSVPLHTHRTFEQWLAEGHALGWPTRDDLAYHLTTLFPPVRPRGWLELRMIDSLPEEWWPVAVAVTVALLDDPSAAEHARRATVTTRERWETAARSSLRDPCFAEAARTCFDAARRALPHLGADPETLVAVDDYRERFIDRARCPADDLLDEWSGRAVPVR